MVDEQQGFQQPGLQPQQQRRVGGVLDGLLELDDGGRRIGVDEMIRQRGVGACRGVAVKAFAQQGAQALRPVRTLRADLELAELERDGDPLLRWLLERAGEMVDREVRRALAGGFERGGAQVRDRPLVTRGLRRPPVRGHRRRAQPAPAQPERGGAVQRPALARRAGVEHRRAHERVDEGAPERTSAAVSRSSAYAEASIGRPATAATSSAVARSPSTATARATATASAPSGRNRRSTAGATPRAASSASPSTAPALAASRAKTDSSSGLPPVASSAAVTTSSGSSPSIVAAASRASGPGRTTCVEGPARSSSSSATGASGSCARVVATSATASPSSRRPRYSRKRSDGTSAQCRSSASRTTGRASARLATSQ